MSNMNKDKLIRQTVFPILAAMIWGTAFSAQSICARYVGPLTFSAARSLVAVIVLGGGLYLWRKIKGITTPLATGKKELLLGGLCCGTLLTVASNFQQLALSDVSAGKAGFVTALYIVLVPVFSIFLGKRAPLSVWLAVGLSAAGLYFLCITDGFTVEPMDGALLICAAVFAGHILAIDRFTRTVDGVALSLMQFAVVGVESALGMLVMEFDGGMTALTAGLSQCIWPILYVGVFSSGVAYTLQILAQKDTDPTVVSVLLSLESVFAVIAGAVLLGDRMTVRELLGCALMMAGVLLAQLPERSK